MIVNPVIHNHFRFINFNAKWFLDNICLCFFSVICSVDIGIQGICVCLCRDMEHMHKINSLLVSYLATL